MRIPRIASLALLLGSASLAIAGTQVRVAHLSPDAPPVDVWVEGSRVLEGVSFPAVSDYLPIEPGTYNVQVTPAGETEPVVIDENLTLERNTDYTIAATGLLGQDDLAPVVLVDSHKSAPGEARVRFSHTSPDAPPVDVALAGGAVLFPDVAFRGSSEYLTVAGGTYDLEVRLAGTDTVVLPLPGVTFEGGVNYEVFAIGLVGDETLGALPTVTSQLPARVRVAHFSPDAPAVDVRVNGELTLEAVPFGAISSYLTVPSGEYRFEVTPAGATEPVVIDATANLAVGTSYTVAATGLLGDDDLSPVVLVDSTDVLPDSGRVRFAHLSPDAPAVDIVVADGGPTLFAGVAFRQVEDYVSVDPGVYDLEVRVAGTDQVALRVPGVGVAAGVNATVFARGLLADESLAAQIGVDIDETFIRGDTNQDDDVDISDPVATLNYLFHGSARVFCSDAADADDDGHVTITDAIFTLGYLFTSGEMPPAPFPAAGIDPTEDVLGCEVPSSS